MCTRENRCNRNKYIKTIKSNRLSLEVNHAYHLSLLCSRQLVSTFDFNRFINYHNGIVISGEEQSLSCDGQKYFLTPILCMIHFHNEPGSRRTTPYIIQGEVEAVFRLIWQKILFIQQRVRRAHLKQPTWLRFRIFCIGKPMYMVLCALAWAIPLIGKVGLPHHTIMGWHCSAPRIFIAYHHLTRASSREKMIKNCKCKFARAKFIYSGFINYLLEQHAFS